MRTARFRRTRRAGAVTLVSALTLTALAACGTSSSNDGDDNGSGNSANSDPAAPLDPKTKVTITIDCMPPAAKAAELKEWNEDVKEFNKTYPNVTVQGRSTPGQCLEPPRFTAMLKAKSQPDVFYTYFTDLAQVLDSDGAQDISAYVNDRTVPLLKDIDPDVLGSLKQDGKLYGLPTSNYRMGLLINRKLFTEAASTRTPRRPPGRTSAPRPGRSRHSAVASPGSASTVPRTPAAGTSPRRCTASAVTSSTPRARRPPSTTPSASRSPRTSTPCAGRTTPWARPSC